MRSRLILIAVAGLVLAAIAALVVGFIDRVRPERDPPSISAEDRLNLSYLPPVLERAETTGTRMTLSGRAEPGASLALRRTDGEDVYVVVDEDGDWEALIEHARDATLSLDLLARIDDAQIHGDERLIHIPAPGSESGLSQNALVIVTVPGGPTRILQSPFGGAVSDGPLSLGPVDYDDAGGVIVTGASTVPGRLRLFSGDTPIGESRSPGGGARWFFSAPDALDDVGADLAVELDTDAGESHRITAVWPRMSSSSPQPVEASIQPYLWQVRRIVAGGGYQTTAVLAPLPDGVIPPEPG